MERFILLSTKYTFAGAILYFKKYTPSGKGVIGVPTGVNPKLVELNVLKLFGTKGKVTTGNPGTVISMVGDVGVVSYVELSAIPNVSAL